jgi:CRP-like cAMP-binding protein
MNNIHFFRKRSLVNLDRADLWQIQSGLVRAIAWLDNDSIATLGFWGAGDIFGKALLQDRNCEFECLTPICAVPLLTESLSQEAIYAHMQQLQELLVMRSCGRIDRMLFDLLAWLGRRFGRPEATGFMLEFSLTHQDLADVLGTTRVTITRSLQQLEERGAICRQLKCQIFVNCMAKGLHSRWQLSPTSIAKIAS